MTQRTGTVADAMKSLDTAIDNIRVKVDKKMFVCNYRKTIVIHHGLQPIVEELNEIKAGGGNSKTFGNIARAGILYLLRYVGMLPKEWDKEIEKYLNIVAEIKDSLAEKQRQ